MQNANDSNMRKHRQCASPHLSSSPLKLENSSLFMSLKWTPGAGRPYCQSSSHAVEFRVWCKCRTNWRTNYQESVSSKQPFRHSCPIYLSHTGPTWELIRTYSIHWNCFTAKSTSLLSSVSWSTKKHALRWNHQIHLKLHDNRSSNIPPQAILKLTKITIQDSTAISYGW